MRPLWRNLLIIALLLWLSGMAACELGVRYELAKIPPEQRARMSDTDWIGAEWIFRGMVMGTVALLVAATALIGQWSQRKRAARSGAD